MWVEYSLKFFFMVYVDIVKLDNGKKKNNGGEKLGKMVGHGRRKTK